MKQVLNIQCVYNSHNAKKQGGLVCWCVWDLLIAVAPRWPVTNRSSLKPLLSGWITMLVMDSQGPIISKWIMPSYSHVSLATDWIWAWHYGSSLQIWNLHKEYCALHCFFFFFFVVCKKHALCNSKLCMLRHMISCCIWVASSYKLKKKKYIFFFLIQFWEIYISAFQTNNGAK